MTAAELGFGSLCRGALLAQQVRIGEEVKIFTYLHVKEDAMQLYGFFTKDDLEVFKLLFECKWYRAEGCAWSIVRAYGR